MPLAPDGDLGADSCPEHGRVGEEDGRVGVVNAHGRGRKSWRVARVARMRQCESARMSTRSNLQAGAELASEWANDSHHDSSHEIASKINWEGRRLEPFEKVIFAVN